jgi:hypothetical protein
MKTLLKGLVAFGLPLLALAQEDARDTVREMGGGPGAIAPGADVTGAHRDTQRIERVEQRVPTSLQSAQASTGTKLTGEQMKRLQSRKRILLQDLKAKVDQAGAHVEKMQMARATPGQKSLIATREVAHAREKAKLEWDSKHGGELRAIEHTLETSPGNQSVAPLRVPAVLNPK